MLRMRRSLICVSSHRLNLWKSLHTSNVHHIDKSIGKNPTTTTAASASSAFKIIAWYIDWGACIASHQFKKWYFDGNDSLYIIMCLCDWNIMISIRILLPYINIEKCTQFVRQIVCFALIVHTNQMCAPRVRTHSHTSSISTPNKKYRFKSNAQLYDYRHYNQRVLAALLRFRYLWNGFCILLLLLLYFHLIFSPLLFFRLNPSQSQCVFFLCAYEIRNSTNNINIDIKTKTKRFECSFQF